MKREIQLRHIIIINFSLQCKLFIKKITFAEDYLLRIMEKPFGRMLSLISKSYLHSLNFKLSDLGINRNYYALVLIDNANGDITQQELASLLEIDKVTMLRSINYLSSNGLVERVRSNTDKRKYCLVLTKKAKQSLPKIKAAIHELNNLALKGLTHSQIEELKNALSIIKNNLEEKRN